MPRRDAALLRRARSELTQDVDRTRVRIAALMREVTTIVDATRDANADDEHDPEGSTIAFDRAQTSALLHSAREHLLELHTALRRIEDGTFGRCERCGEPIPAERLEIRPEARTCVPCANHPR